MPRYTFKVDAKSVSISLEPEFQQALKDIARIRGMAINALVREISERGPHKNLSADARIYILEYFMEVAAAECSDLTNEQNCLGKIAISCGG